MKSYYEVPAIRDRDLISILDHLELLDKIRNNQLHCTYCDRVITLENILALKRISDTTLIYCDNIDCVDNALEGRNGEE